MQLVHLFTLLYGLVEWIRQRKKRKKNWNYRTSFDEDIIVSRPLPPAARIWQTFHFKHGAIVAQTWKS